MAGKFEIKKAKDGQFYFHLMAGNGQNILASEMYKEKGSAENGIESVKKNAPDDFAEIFPKHRLHHVFIGAGLERARPIDAVIAPGDDDDFRPEQFLPDAAAGLETIRFRHEQIAKDELGAMGEGELDAGVAISRFKDFPSLAEEELACRPARFGIILDQQNGGHEWAILFRGTATTQAFSARKSTRASAGERR